ncbi:hypothetical protein [Deinococcus deserti]|nr:hypothetical protein [Deinococcus deserti]
MVTFLLGSVLARQDVPISAQMAEMAGTQLTFAECQERLQKLNTMLGGVGYGAVRTQQLNDGTLAARWYNSTAKRTALAFSGQNAVGNAFHVSEQDGLISLNELIATP